MRKVKPGEPVRIAARDWNRMLDASNLVLGNGVGARINSASNFGLIWVWVKNTSGSDRSRYDCMSLGNLLFDIETNAQQDPIFEATVAAKDKQPIILLEAIASNQFGRAAIQGLTLAKVATAGHANMRDAGANAAGHNLLAGVGQIRLMAAPSTSAATLRPVLLGPFNQLVHVKTKASCVAANDTTGAMTAVSCDRFITATDGTQTDAGYDVDVYNPGGPIDSGKWGTAMLNAAGLLEFVVVKCG